MYKGKPCHFVSIGKGCSIYGKRPQDPCVVFKCGWLADEHIPEWMKPNEINAIIKMDKMNDIPYLAVIEAGEVLQSRVLSWLIQHALSHQLNFLWYINGGANWVGSPEFHQAMLDSPIDKSAHSTPKRLLPVVEAE